MTINLFLENWFTSYVMKLIDMRPFYKYIISRKHRYVCKIRRNYLFSNIDELVFFRKHPYYFTKQK